MTTLVLQLQDRTLEVHSDRLGLQHALFNDELRVYIPEDPRQQRTCRRSQLPGMLAIITGCNPAANDDFSAILSSPIEDLDSDTLGGNEDLHRTDSVLSNEHTAIDELTVQSASSRQRVVSVGPGRLSNDYVTAESEFEEAVALRMGQYCKLLDQLVACAYGRENITNHRFCSSTTFGYPGVDNFEYNRRIGAAGEAYVRLSHSIRI